MKFRKEIYICRLMYEKMVFEIFVYFVYVFLKCFFIVIIIVGVFIDFNIEINVF